MSFGFEHYMKTEVSISSNFFLYSDFRHQVVPYFERDCEPQHLCSRSFFLLLVIYSMLFSVKRHPMNIFGSKWSRVRSFCCLWNLQEYLKMFKFENLRTSLTLQVYIDQYLLSSLSYSKKLNLPTGTANFDRLRWLRCFPWELQVIVDSFSSKLFLLATSSSLRKTTYTPF